MAKIKPLAKIILVKPRKADTKTKSGLYLPEGTDQQRSPQLVEVVSWGKEVELKEIKKVGQHIIIEKYGGDEVTVDGVDYIMIAEDKILGTYDE